MMCWNANKFNTEKPCILPTESIRIILRSSSDFLITQYLHVLSHKKKSLYFAVRYDTNFQMYFMLILLVCSPPILNS